MILLEIGIVVTDVQKTKTCTSHRFYRLTFCEVLQGLKTGITEIRMQRRIGGIQSVLELANSDIKFIRVNGKEIGA